MPADVQDVLKQEVRATPKTTQGHLMVVSTHLWNTPLNLYQQAIMGFLS